jgi:glycosyltransferase involved in cell wall biosynthesis
MRVLFYQPSFTGHYFAYLARMLPGFIGLPVEIVVATTPEAIESKEFAKTLAPLADSIHFVACCTPATGRPLSIARHRLRELVRAIRTTEPDHVIDCYSDGIWEMACLGTMLGRRPWPSDLVIEGGLYRGRFGDPADRSRKAVLRRWMFKRLLHQGLYRRLHLHHELLYEFAARAARDTPTEVMLAPDPISIRPLTSSQDARRELAVIGDGPWIGMAGVIARFKGAHLFLEAYRLRRERSSQPTARALLAGPHQEQIRGILHQAPYRGWIEDGSIVSVDRFLGDAEMYAAAAAVDVVVAPYPDRQNRSSIILWAAAAGRRCLGTDESCIDHVIRHEQLGLTTNVLDTGALADGMTAALNMNWTDADVARVRRYAEFHRSENYQRLSSELIRERLATQAVVRG